MNLLQTKGSTNPAPIHAAGDARHIPKYPIRPGRIIAAITLRESSRMLLSIGIEPEPRPWLPVLKMKIKPRGMKKGSIQKLVCF